MCDQYECIIWNDTVFSSLLYFCDRVRKYLWSGWVFPMILESSFDIYSIPCCDWYCIMSYGSSDDLVYISIFPLPLLSVSCETEKEPPTL